MKKLTLFLAMCVIAGLSFAQPGETLKSKKGFNILPEAGDIALGFDAVPVIDFALNAINIMNNTGQTAQHPGYVSGFNQIIVGKYFLEDKKAVRARLGINTLSTSGKLFGDNPLTPNVAEPENILLETNKITNSSYFFGAGLEMRRGHNRLQGFYGGELMVGISSSNLSNSYEITYNQAAQDAGYMNVGSSRLLSSKSGSALSLGIRGFIGVEYFIAPKISIGAEFGWGIGMITDPRGTVETEFWDIEPGTNNTEPTQFTRETKGNNSDRSWGFGVDDGAFAILGGSAALTVLFHF